MLHYVHISLFKFVHLLLDAHFDYIVSHPLAIYKKIFEVKRFIKKTHVFSLSYRGPRNLFCWVNGVYMMAVYARTPNKLMW